MTFSPVQVDCLMRRKDYSRIKQSAGTTDSGERITISPGTRSASATILQLGSLGVESFLSSMNYCMILRWRRTPRLMETDALVCWTVGQLDTNLVTSTKNVQQKIQYILYTSISSTMHNHQLLHQPIVPESPCSVL